MTNGTRKLLTGCCVVLPSLWLGCSGAPEESDSTTGTLTEKAISSPNLGGIATISPTVSPQYSTMYCTKYIVRTTTGDCPTLPQWAGCKLRVSDSTVVPQADDGFCLYTWTGATFPPDTQALADISMPRNIPNWNSPPAVWPVCGSRPAAQCAMTNVPTGTGLECTAWPTGCRAEHPLVSGCGSCGHVTDGKLVLVGLPPGNYKVSFIGGSWYGSITVPAGSSLVYSATLPNAPSGSYWTKVSVYKSDTESDADASDRPSLP